MRYTEIIMRSLWQDKAYWSTLPVEVIDTVHKEGVCVRVEAGQVKGFFIEEEDHSYE